MVQTDLYRITATEKTRNTTRRLGIKARFARNMRFGPKQNGLKETQISLDLWQYDFILSSNQDYYSMIFETFKEYTNVTHGKIQLTAGLLRFRSGGVSRAEDGVSKREK